MHLDTFGRLIRAALAAFLVAAATGCLKNEPGRSTGTERSTEPARQARPTGPLTAKQVLTLRCDGLCPEASSAVFSPDGKYLAATSSQRVRVWDAATGEVVRTLE